MYGGDGSSDGGPKGSFEIFKAEGDVLFKHGEFKKALDSFNTALELRPGDKNTLVARSQCYLEIGDSERALNDANETLNDDQNYIKGLLQKAEAFYQKGRFEHALMFYHRGHKLRPEVQAFRLGIQKAQEAIHNSVGVSEVKLKNEGDLTIFYEDLNKGKPKKTVGYNKPLIRGKNDNQNNARPIVNRDRGTVKQLLGELYQDKEYLENLLIESECQQNKSDSKQAIRTLSLDGLTFLDKRMDFWQQQQRNARNAARNRQGGTGKKAGDTKWILNSLEAIDEAQASGQYAYSLSKAKTMLKNVISYCDALPNKPAVIANIHSCMGNSLLELGRNEKALEHHEKDFEISKQNDLEEGRSRALDNLGRVYARMKQFDKAIQVWEEKLPSSDSPLERTWLLHEIGRCHLEVGAYDRAREYGVESLQSAVGVDDVVWQLNSSVLVAQALVKLEKYDDSLTYFEESLSMAKQQSDNAALQAIQNAIQDVKSSIAAQQNNNNNNNSNNNNANGDNVDGADDNDYSYESENDFEPEGEDKKEDETDKPASEDAKSETAVANQDEE